MGEGRKPNQKYEHVFVVLRLDELARSSTPRDQAIVATKAFWRKEEAEEEVERLSRQNRSGSLYFWRVARLNIVDGSRNHG
jgi:hypothetical protein